MCCVHDIMGTLNGWVHAYAMYMVWGLSATAVFHLIFFHDDRQDRPSSGKAKRRRRTLPPTRGTVATARTPLKRRWSTKHKGSGWGCTRCKAWCSGKMEELVEAAAAAEAAKRVEAAAEARKRLRRLFGVEAVS